MALKITQRMVEDIAIIKVDGNLTLTERNLSEIERDLEDMIERGKVKVVIDLSQVDHIDSSGLGVLICVFIKARRREGDVKLYKTTEKVNSILITTKLHRVFEQYETMEEAIESFQKDKEEKDGN